MAQGMSLKGGKRAHRPEQTLLFICSDLVGDRPATIGIGAPLGITSTPISSVTGPFVSVAAADAAQNAASAEQSAVVRVLLCFIVVPPYALRSSGLTNLILIVAVELYLKGLLPAILATVSASVGNLMLFCANVPRWPSSSAKGRYCRNGAICCPAREDGYPPCAARPTTALVQARMQGQRRPSLRWP